MRASAASRSFAACSVTCQLCAQPLSAGLLKRGNDQLDRGSPAVTLDFNGGNRRFEHESDHLVAKRITDSAQA